MLLQVCGVTGEKSEQVLFQNLSFTVACGQCLHVVGGNGCGKTSLLRMLAGLSQVNEGKIVVGGRLAFLGHQWGLSDYLTVKEMCQYWQVLYGFTGSYHDLLAEAGLALCQTQLTMRLSAGQKRRLTLVRLQMQQAALWLLDEPFNALDNTGQQWLHHLIVQQLQGQGGVVLTSHQALSWGDVKPVVLAL